jgi:multidrug transporter EmrE-like cation transporter
MREHALYLAVLVSISLINSVGQIMMRWGGKQSAAASRPSPTQLQWLWTSRWWLLGIVITWLCGLGWAWCLRRLPLAVALPVYSGLVYGLSVLGGAYLLKEKLSSIQTVGVLLIIVGMLLVMSLSAPRPDAPIAS